VAYLGCELPNGDLKIGGTVFFVARPFGAMEGKNFTYAVTAKHCLDGIRKLGADFVVIRLNTREGGFVVLRMPISGWVSHPTDKSVDVSIFRLNLPNTADHKVFPIEGFMSDQFMSDMQIGVGDEVFISGLFAPHIGATKNIPIVRIGNIAAMPEELVDTADFGKMKAFLLECRSIGGLSGSPVFASPGPVRVLGERVWLNQTNFLRQFRILGLMHGHFAFPPLSKIIGDDPLTRERLNMGIAIVPTYDKILEVLNQPFVQDYEARALEEFRRNGLPDADSGFSSEQGD
jgi:hypothetical protein